MEKGYGRKKEGKKEGKKERKRKKGRKGKKKIGILEAAWIGLR